MQHWKGCSERPQEPVCSSSASVCSKLLLGAAEPEPAHPIPAVWWHFWGREAAPLRARGGALTFGDLSVVLVAVQVQDAGAEAAIGLAQQAEHVGLPGRVQAGEELLVLPVRQRAARHGRHRRGHGGPRQGQHTCATNRAMAWAATATATAAGHKGAAGRAAPGCWHGAERWHKHFGCWPEISLHPPCLQGAGVNGSPGEKNTKEGKNPKIFRSQILLRARFGLGESVLILVLLFRLCVCVCVCVCFWGDLGLFVVSFYVRGFFGGMYMSFFYFSPQKPQHPEAPTMTVAPLLPAPCHGHIPVHGAIPPSPPSPLFLQLGPLSCCLRSLLCPPPCPLQGPPAALGEQS